MSNFLIQKKTQENQVTIHLFIILLFINPLNFYAPCVQTIY